MNRPATKPCHSPVAVTTIVAKLDLADEGQRELHDFIRRMHGGRWPTLRALGMRQIDGAIFEAVEWLRMERPNFGVIRWRPDGLGMSSQAAETEREARERLNLADPLSSATGQLPRGVELLASSKR